MSEMELTVNNLLARLKEVRRSKGITQEELSRQTGLSVAYISQLENDKGRSPSLEVFLLLTSALEISLSEFFGPYSKSKNGESEHLAKEIRNTREEILFKLEELEKVKDKAEEGRNMDKKVLVTLDPEILALDICQTNVYDGTTVGVVEISQETPEWIKNIYYNAVEIKKTE